MAVKMSEIPQMERPRERFLYHDIDGISNEELLAILLKTGTKGENAKGVASSVLALVDSLSNLDELTIEKLKTIKGIGDVKAITFLATIELGKRMNQSRNSIQNQVFRNSVQVYEYYHFVLKDKKQEYFYCIYLDNRKRMIKEKLLFIGTITHSTIHPREIFKEACLVSATSFICVHNHPSGSPIPSKMDLEFTKQLQALSYEMGIPILDHIIIGCQKYYSFFENNDL